jgi:hypothetical protein
MERNPEELKVLQSRGGRAEERMIPFGADERWSNMFIKGGKEEGKKSSQEGGKKGNRWIAVRWIGGAFQDGARAGGSVKVEAAGRAAFVCLELIRFCRRIGTVGHS